MTRVLLVRHGETTWNREGRVQGWAGAPLSGRGRDQARATGMYLREQGVDRIVASDLRRTQETARLLREGEPDLDGALTRGGGSTAADASTDGPAGDASAGDTPTGDADPPVGDADAGDADAGDADAPADAERDGSASGRREFATARGVDAPLSFDRAWRERDFGEFQGLDLATVAERHDEFDPEASLTGVATVPGGESRDRFRERVTDGWDTLVDGITDEGTVVVVAHGGSIRVVVADVTGRNFAALAREWSPDNCGITEIDVDGDPELVRRNDTAHLE